jgi:hypothetical protein
MIHPYLNTDTSSSSLTLRKPLKTMKPIVVYSSCDCELKMAGPWERVKSVRDTTLKNTFQGKWKTFSEAIFFFRLTFYCWEHELDIMPLILIYQVIWEGSPQNHQGPSHGSTLLGEAEGEEEHPRQEAQKASVDCNSHSPNYARCLRVDMFCIFW